jgi:Zn-dependent protease with chaperone function
MDWHQCCSGWSVNRAAVLFVLATAGLVPGCADASRSREAWVQQEGGLVAGDAQARVERVARPLSATCGGLQVMIRVLDSTTPCAYGWPDGSIFVTRGLLDLLNDEELAAAVAHELGHLLEDGHLHGPMSLQGDCGKLDDEERADRRGCELLEAAGLPPHAMARSLRKVARAPGAASPRARQALEQRASRLPHAAPSER